MHWLNKLITIRLFLSVILAVSLFIFVAATGTFVSKASAACGWCAGQDQCGPAGGNAVPDSSCTPGPGTCCVIGSSSGGGGGGGGSTTSSFSCWCTGTANDCSFGGVAGDWSGGEGYCNQNFRCCYPKPVSSGSTTTATPINGESCGWCAGNDQCQASTGHAGTAVVNSAVCSTGVCCTGYTAPTSGAGSTTATTADSLDRVSGLCAFGTIHGTTQQATGGNYCTCPYGYTCEGLSGSVQLVDITTSAGVTQVVSCFGSSTATADIKCNKIGGSPTTLSGSEGAICDNPLSRSACGSASGCPSGQQRLCSGGKLGACVITDACASQVQTVSEGASCSDLTRLSLGEPSKGQFVGCQGSMNCFCSTAGGSGTVQCYADDQNDSCGAPGIGTSVTPTLTSSAGGGTTTSSLPKSVCGEACTADTDCATPASSAYGVRAICRAGKCENASCTPGQTVPGANCTCGDNTVKCGQPCGHAFGLCGAGQGVCRYVNVDSAGSCPWGWPQTYCVGESNGYSTPRCTSGDAPGGAYLVGPNGNYNGFSVSELSNTCSVCGDGIVQPPEECDAGSKNGTSETTCGIDCRYHVAPICLSLSKDIENPRFGQSVRFTCGTIPNATRYEFQYKLTTSQSATASGNQTSTKVAEIKTVNAAANVTEPFAVNQPGSYQVQCRPCVGNECSPWAENW